MIGEVLTTYTDGTISVLRFMKLMIDLTNLIGDSLHKNKCVDTTS